MLTQAEIQAEAASETVVRTSGLQGAWAFAGDALDASANGNDLTLYNGAGYSAGVNFPTAEGLQFVNAASQSASAAASVVLAVPVFAKAGDLLLAGVALDSATAPASPAGWTALGQTTTPAASRWRCITAIADGTESPLLSVGLSGGGLRRAARHHGGIPRHRPAAPIGASRGRLRRHQRGSHACPAVSSPTSDGILVSMLAIFTVPSSIDPPAGADAETERLEFIPGAPESLRDGARRSRARRPHGAIASRTYTTPELATSAAGSIVLRAPPPAPAAMAEGAGGLPWYER